MLHILTAKKPDAANQFFGIDVSTNRGQTPILLEEKADRLANRNPTPFQMVRQADQLRNPESKVILCELVGGTRLGDIAVVSEGLHTGDYPRFGRKHWELPMPREGWARQQGGTGEDEGEGGCEHVLYWQDGKGDLIEFVQERLGGQSTSMWIKGEEVWGKRGVSVGTMNELRHSHYTGALFTHGIVAVVPNESDKLPALWCYISSDQFRRDVRQLDQKVSVARASIENVQLDLAHWEEVAKATYPNGLPVPASNDPTQWLFKGDIAISIVPLQSAVTRLVGYRWPEQPKTEDAIGKLADGDGIVCLPGVRGEPAAAERLLEVLHTAYGKNWSDSVLHKLLTDAGCKAGTTLDDWLRNHFFDQHCKVFHQRPFIWHIWDGRKDGFSALVNYHKLTHKALENLTYSYLGDWITAQSKSDKVGADLRLAAAQELQEKLKLILAGEPPYDIFVRWKPFHEQPIGWNPDLNDGVRMNIRPFVQAGILRKTPNIKWTKDRGKEPERDKDDYPWFWSGNSFVGDRVNDIHLTNAEKQAARTRKKGAK